MASQQQQQSLTHLSPADLLAPSARAGRGPLSEEARRMMQAAMQEDAAPGIETAEDRIAYAAGVATGQIDPSSFPQDWPRTLTF